MAVVSLIVFWLEGNSRRLPTAGVAGVEVVVVVGGGANKAAAAFVEDVVGFGMAKGLFGADGKISEDRLESGCLEGGIKEVLEELLVALFLALPMARLDISCNLRSSALRLAMASSTTSTDREDLGVGGLRDDGGPCLALMLPGVAPPRCFLAIGGPLVGDNSMSLCFGLFMVILFVRSSYCNATMILIYRQ